MTKLQAVELFKEEVLPFINRKEKPLLRQSWNDYTDFLCKNNEITLKQYETWTQPRFISGRK